jgi:myosin-3
LQYHFNNFLFTLEQAEYEEQGVQVTRTNFIDNGPCLELLEKQHVGVFAMIDEEIQIPRVLMKNCCKSF